ncbi:MAG TPA: hypothetical protein VKV40_18275 [Ktedonobacteraceae bacterium]|nr:hypothetical protein [Ktedonobacteraceae bacterium]
MANPSPNPYFNLAIVRNAEMFFGRASLLKRFYVTIANCQSVSLLGSRYIGKSSFLWYTTRPEAQKLFPFDQKQFPFDLSSRIFVFLDLREFLTKTCEDFFHSVSKEILVQSKKAGLSLQPEGEGQDEFSNLLDQIAEQRHFPVLLLDGFDQVTRNKHFGPEFFWFLRSQASVGLVTYITASLKPLSEVCHPDIVGSPFFNIFYLYHLDALTPDEAEALIRQPAARAALPFTEEEVALVQHLAGRHPFFIQRVCHALFEEKCERGMVSEQRLKNLAYKDLRPRFQTIWEELTETQQQQLQDEAQQKGNQQRLLPELSESALFRQFVRDTCEARLFHLTLEELEDALEKIEDSSALGTTNLRLMKAVTMRLERDSLASTARRGVVIREILSEALESLRGNGMRTESAPDWKYYNILLYRYFKRRYKNNQIATRLQISSMRQFYRERLKALELLLNALFEMEHMARSPD